MKFNPVRAVVHNEACDLHYWYQGAGPMLLFVPGGNGHGKQYDKLVGGLSDRYTCVAFDRRQMSASQVEANKRLNPFQQARDIVSIIQAMGFKKSTVFGSSLGGLIGYVLAAEHADVVEHLITHEAPSTWLLPDYLELFEWTLGLAEICDSQGWAAANNEFRKSFVGYNIPGVPPHTPGGPQNTKSFWENEFLIGTTFRPDLQRVRDNGTSVGIMRGERSGEAFYARGTYKQAEVLGCPRHDVPGHHQGFEAEFEAFLPHLERMLELLKETKAAQA